jgi:hypothetical protein
MSDTTAVYWANSMWRDDMAYLLFCGSEYYPAGGADDYVGAFDSIADAKEYLTAQPAEWAHIATFDGKRMQIVCAYGPTGEPGRPGVPDWHDCNDG